jgi:hypothetical protein
MDEGGPTSDPSQGKEELSFSWHALSTTVLKELDTSL